MHALSVFGLRSDHMSPAAILLASMLHALVALAVWWMTQHQPHLPPSQEPVEIVFEQPVNPTPKPPPPKPPPQQQPVPKPEAQKPLLGLPPPAAITADKATQVPSKAAELAPQRPMEMLPQEPPSLEQTVPPPQAEPAPPSDNAFLIPKRIEPPRPEPKPENRPNPPSEQIHVRPSPLMPGLQRKPPAVALGEDPSPSPFVNPADTYNRARVGDNYRWQIVRRLAGYRFEAKVNVSEGTTVVRIVLARDGRLLNVAIIQSSGYPLLDQGVVAGVRSGSPYDPLPADIAGETATFDLPLVATFRR